MLCNAPGRITDQHMVIERKQAMNGLGAFMAFEDLNRVIASLEINARGILNPGNAFTFGKDFNGQLARYDEHAIYIAEDEVSRIDDDGFG